MTTLSSRSLARPLIAFVALLMLVFTSMVAVSDSAQAQNRNPDADIVIDHNWSHNSLQINKSWQSGPLAETQISVVFEVCGEFTDAEGAVLGLSCGEVATSQGDPIVNFFELNTLEQPADGELSQIYIAEYIVTPTGRVRAADTSEWTVTASRNLLLPYVVDFANTYNGPEVTVDGGDLTVTKNWYPYDATEIPTVAYSCVSSVISSMNPMELRIWPTATSSEWTASTVVQPLITRSTTTTRTSQ